MKPINILCVGNLRENYWKDASREYEKRLKKYCDINIIELKESDADNESKLIIKKTDQKTFVVLCELSGKKLNSEIFSGLINEKLDSHSGITIIIGGSEGVNDEVRKSADMLLSFSDMTFPHQMFRVILLEQIYRAFKIMKNEKYHK